jgi:hypothetical protein
MNLSRRIKELEAQASPMPRRTVIITTESPRLPSPYLVEALESEAGRSQPGMSSLVLLWDGRALVCFEEWLKQCERGHAAALSM